MAANKMLRVGAVDGTGIVTSTVYLVRCLVTPFFFASGKNAALYLVR